MKDANSQLQNKCRELADGLTRTDEHIAHEIIESALDIDFTINRQGLFQGARILVAFGGPSIWIDTRYDRVEGSWWGGRSEASYQDTNDLHDICEEMFYGLK